jgi:superfamily I DNA/RNA helicase
MPGWLDGDGGSRFWPEDDEEAPPAHKSGPGPLVSRLDPEWQLPAATAAEPHVLVVAAAGSGKTTVLTARIEHVLDQGAHPGAIWALTFSRKAAGELGRRLGENVGLGACSTFHSALFHNIIRHYPHVVGLRRPRPLNDGQALSRLRWTAIELNREYKLNLPETLDALRASVWQEFELCRRRMERPRDKAWAMLFSAYLKQLADADEVDFAGMVGHALTILRENEGARREVAGSIEHLLVDELQDTDHQQLELVRLLASEGAHFFGVGDADQSIYHFRGAAPDNLRRIKGYFPDLKVYHLPVTYRCPPAVVDLAKRLIAFNPESFPGARAPLACLPGKWDGKGAPPVIVKHCASTEAIAEYVTRTVLELLGAGVAPGDIAVLYRSRSSARSVRRSLRQAGVYFVEAGALPLWRRAVTRELHFFGDACLDPVRNDGSLLEVAQRESGPLKLGLGMKTLDKLMNAAVDKGLSLAEVLVGEGSSDKEGRPGGDRLLDMLAEGHDRLEDGPQKFFNWAQGVLRIPERLDSEGKEQDLGELMAAAEQASYAGVSVADFFAELESDDPAISGEGAVSLSTVHAAKSLEWPYVLLLGLEKGIWPDKRSPSGEELAEERRLLHTAITRTAWQLYVVGTTDGHTSPWFFEVAKAAQAYGGERGQ